MISIRCCHYVFHSWGRMLCLRGLGQKLARGEDLTGAGWFETVPRALRAHETAASALGGAECRRCPTSLSPAFAWPWPSSAAAWRERKKESDPTGEGEVKVQTLPFLGLRQAKSSRQKQREGVFVVFFHCGWSRYLRLIDLTFHLHILLWEAISGCHMWAGAEASALRRHQ